jgi:hypothetical protein
LSRSFLCLCGGDDGGFTGHRRFVSDRIHDPGRFPRLASRFANLPKLPPKYPALPGGVVPRLRKAAIGKTLPGLFRQPGLERVDRLLSRVRRGIGQPYPALACKQQIGFSVLRTGVTHPAVLRWFRFLIPFPNLITACSPIALL